MTVTLHRCSDDFIRGVIEEHHYLHRWPDPRSLPFGYCIEVYEPGMAAPMRTSHHDKRPLGVLVFKLLQHKRQRELFGYRGLPTQWQVLDLARVWIHPHMQYTWLGKDRHGQPAVQSHNLFSRSISLALKRVQRDWLDFHGVRFMDQPYHIELVVSYCDRKHHQGTGYRAAGFILFGETSDGTKDLYIRRLKAPRWSYEPPQLSLLEESA